MHQPAAVCVFADGWRVRCACVCVRVRPALPGPLISARLGCNILLPLAPCGSLWKTSEPLMMNVSHEWGNVKLQLPPSRALPLLLQQYTHLVCSSTGTTFAAVQRYTEQGQISKLSSPFSFGTNTALLPFYQKYIKVTEPLYIKIAMWQYLFFFIKKQTKETYCNYNIDYDIMKADEEWI